MLGATSGIRQLTASNKEREDKISVRTSTNPVYTKIPALTASSTPLTMLALALPGLYDSRTPRPIAMPRGVVMPKARAAHIGRFERDREEGEWEGEEGEEGEEEEGEEEEGRERYARREPTPRPSNVSVSEANT